MDHLIEVLRLIAADYQVQRDALPQLASLADEIALLYSDELRNVMPSSLIADDEVRAKLVSMDRLFETMSETKSFWTDEAVSTGAEWQQLRQRARDVLAYLKQPLEAPRLTWLTYVQSG